MTPSNITAKYCYSDFVLPNGKWKPVSRLLPAWKMLAAYACVDGRLLGLEGCAASCNMSIVPPNVSWCEISPAKSDSRQGQSLGIIDSRLTDNLPDNPACRVQSV